MDVREKLVVYHCGKIHTGKWERELIADFEPEIKNILQIKEYMSAEDIGDLVVVHAERLRKEAEKAKEK